MRRRQAPVHLAHGEPPGPFDLEEWAPFVPPEPDDWPLPHWREMHAAALWFKAMREYAHRAGLDAYALAYPHLDSRKRR